MTNQLDEDVKRLRMRVTHPHDGNATTVEVERLARILDALEKRTKALELFFVYYLPDIGPEGDELKTVAWNEFVKHAREALSEEK